MLQSNELNDISQPDTPKSKAKDKNGFHRKDITEIIRSQTLKEIILNYKWIIKPATENYTGAILLQKHRQYY